jgi:hypothetical protein
MCGNSVLSIKCFIYPWLFVWNIFCSDTYCTVLAVLVRFTEHTTLFVTLFYLWLHESVLQSLFTLSTDPCLVSGRSFDVLASRRLAGWLTDTKCTVLGVYPTSDTKCAMLAVLVRFTEHTTLIVTLFYLRLHESVLQSLFTLSTDPLMSCLGAVFWCLSLLKAGCWLTDFLLSLVTCWLFATGSVTNLTHSGCRDPSLNRHMRYENETL